MRRATGALAVLLLGLINGAPAAAFIRQAVDVNGQIRHPRWPLNHMPIHFRVNNHPLELLPNLASNSLPMEAIQAAMQAWSVGPVKLMLDGETPVANVAYDGVSLITFADTPTNRTFVGQSLVNTAEWYSNGTDGLSIHETDIVVNPSMMFATDGRKAAFDLQSRLTYALGYALGLDDSPIAADRRYPFVHLGESPQRTLSTDDTAGVLALYDLSVDASDGAIAGKVVTTANAPVFGAHVTAVDSQGILRVGAMTEKDGSFIIPSLPVGSYQVYAEPIDGPLTTSYLSTGYATILHSFQTEFAGGNLTPLSIPVTAGQTTAIDPIAVVARGARVKLEFLSQSPNGHSFAPAYPQALPLHPGESLFLEVAAGTGLPLVLPTGFSVSGDGVTIDPTSYQTNFSPAGNRYVVLRVTAAPDAPLGPRSLYATVGAERAVFSGAINVVAPDGA